MKRSSPVTLRQTYGRPPANIEVSVIIVAYKTGDELFDCLDSLRTQTYKNFETIVVDNDTCDTTRLAAYNLTYVRLNANYGPSFARNQGATLAKGSILFFLDDDAITSPQWITSGVTALQANSHYCAVRGRIKPKQQTYPNKLAYHYDLGPTPHPAFLDLEGNCAVRTHAYRAVGGFNAELFGGEGLDLSYRLEEAGQGSIGYEPDMLLYHNFVDSWRHFLDKSYRHGRNEAKLSQQDPAVAAYKQRYLRYYTPAAKPPLLQRSVLFMLYMASLSATQAGKYTARLHAR